MFRICSFFPAIVFAIALGVSADDQLIDRQALIDDTRVLVETIESVHPDPYLRGGGKIAFHRRYQQTLTSIPDSGLTPGQFYSHLEELVASVGDGHTFLTRPGGFDPYSPGGIPLYFETCAEGLYVLGVLSEELRHLLGARLVSVEGVSFDRLVDRFRRKRGADNHLLLYRNLGGQGVLWYGDRLRAILPEWQQKDSVRVCLHVSGEGIKDFTLAVPATVDYASIITPSTRNLALLSDYMTELQRTDMFYRFLDSTHQTCLLVIHNLATYREAFEAWRSLGVTNRDAQARALYQRYKGTTPPENIDDVIAGLPSATELLSSMAEDMKKYKTSNLLIDLSQNDGGSSLLGGILLYFLYGREGVWSVRGRTTEIVKYSPEYFEIYPTPSLDDINSDRHTPYTASDYDFTADHGNGDYPGIEQVREDFEGVVSWMPTFECEYRSGNYCGYYLPNNVMVLCDAGTFSAAFTVMYYLKQAGAKTVGIPSAQAGNCFGDIVNFRLPNSGLAFSVSRKYFELFPDDPVMGRVYVPDHLMTYDVLASYDFDPGALIWFATDLLD